MAKFKYGDLVVPVGHGVNEQNYKFRVTATRNNQVELDDKAWADEYELVAYEDCLWFWNVLTTNGKWEITKTRLSEKEISQLNKYKEYSKIKVLGFTRPNEKLDQDIVYETGYYNMSFEEHLEIELGEIKDMLIEKNKKYGNSALEPARVFSKANMVEQILVRIDDKLSRIKNEATNEDEDVIKDLIGYLLILRMAKDTKRLNDEQESDRLMDDYYDECDRGEIGADV